MKLINKLFIVTLLIASLISPAMVNAQDDTNAATLRSIEANGVIVEVLTYFGLGNTFDVEFAGRTTHETLAETDTHEVVRTTEGSVGSYSITEDGATVPITVIGGTVPQHLDCVYFNYFNEVTHMIEYRLVYRYQFFDKFTVAHGEYIVTLANGTGEASTVAANDSFIYEASVLITVDGLPRKCVRLIDNSLSTHPDVLRVLLPMVSN